MSKPFIGCKLSFVIHLITLIYLVTQIKIFFANPAGMFKLLQNHPAAQRMMAHLGVKECVKRRKCLMLVTVVDIIG